MVLVIGEIGSGAVRAAPGASMTRGDKSGTTSGTGSNPAKIEEIAARIRQAEVSGIAIGPVRDELAGGGIAMAYDVQAANTAYHLGQGRRLVGGKVGLTSKAVQAQLGVDSPDFGWSFLLCGNILQIK